MKKFIAICLSTIFTLSYANNILASDISLDKAIEIKEAKKIEYNHHKIFQ